MDESQLKHCPFCGGKAELKTNKKYRKGYIAYVGCASQLCGAKVSQATMYGGRDEAYQYAIKFWNKRVQGG